METKRIPALITPNGLSPWSCCPCRRLCPLVLRAHPAKGWQRRQCSHHRRVPRARLLCVKVCDFSQAAEFIMAGGFHPAHWPHCAAGTTLQPPARAPAIYMTKWEPVQLAMESRGMQKPPGSQRFGSLFKEASSTEGEPAHFAAGPFSAAPSSSRGLRAQGAWGCYVALPRVPQHSILRARQRAAFGGICTEANHGGTLSTPGQGRGTERCEPSLRVHQRALGSLPPGLKQPKPGESLSHMSEMPDAAAPVGH